MKKIILALLVASFVAAPLFAATTTTKSSGSPRGPQNLLNMVGIGFTAAPSNPDQGDVSEVSVRWWVSKTVGVEAGLGLGVGDGPGVFLFKGKTVIALKNYQTVNIYFAGTAMIQNMSTPAPQNPLGGGGGASQSTTMFAVGPGFGFEWFVINNLSLSAEAGLRLTVGKGYTRFDMYSGWFPEIGVRFYF